jgi:hypothetical protein
MNPLKIMNPVAVTRGAFTLAGTVVGSAVGLVGTVAREGAHVLLSAAHLVGTPDEPQGGPAEPDGASAFVGPDQRTAGAADADDSDVDGAPPGPTIVAAEPHAPQEPPIDVVGQALAAEAALGDLERPEGAGLAHEPRGASRDEEHGDAPLQRAETEGIEDEVAAALEGDVEPEEHLTEPLLDPAEAKALAAEMRTMTRAADPYKS